MSWIMDLIEPELLELSALALENLPYIYTIASANINQPVPILATIYMPIRSLKSSIMGQIEAEHLSYLPMNLEKLLNLTVYALASTNINQSASNVVKMYVTI